MFFSYLSLNQPQKFYFEALKINSERESYFWCAFFRMNVEHT